MNDRLWRDKRDALTCDGRVCIRGPSGDKRLPILVSAPRTVSIYVFISLAYAPRSSCSAPPFHIGLPAPPRCVRHVALQRTQWSATREGT